MKCEICKKKIESVKSDDNSILVVDCLSGKVYSSISCNIGGFD